MDTSKLITEQSSKYNDLEKMGTLKLLTNINREDKSIAVAVEKSIPAIHKLVDVIVSKMKREEGCFILVPVLVAD